MRLSPYNLDLYVFVKIRYSERGLAGGFVSLPERADTADILWEPFAPLSVLNLIDGRITVK
jgi:hypothetical protein